MMKTLFGFAVFATVSAYGAAPATEVVVTPIDEAPVLLSGAELETLVGPIALYPDDLLAVVLPASTYPVQVVQAARLLEAAKTDKSVKPDDEWDDSVVALMNYPEVVDLMNRDLDWTWRLGDAVLNQQPDVLNAVEQFRARAQAAGNLKTDERQIVTVTPEAIQIAPADPKVIYVPYYEPARVTVYQRAPVYHYYPVGYPVYYYPYPFGYSFDSGYFWGVTSAYTLGWSTHHVHVRPYYSSFHPYYGHRYYNHYYRRPWYGSNNHHGSGWASNWHRSSYRHDSFHWAHNRKGSDGGGGWEDRGGRGSWDGHRGSDGRREDDRWRHNRARGGARPDGDVARQNQNRFQFPTDRTAFRNSAPDLRTRQSDALTERRSGERSNPRFDQGQRARERQRGETARAQAARPQGQRTPDVVVPQASNPRANANRQRFDNPRDRARFEQQRTRNARNEQAPPAPRTQTRAQTQAQNTPFRAAPNANAQARLNQQANVARNRMQQHARSERRQIDSRQNGRTELAEGAARQQRQRIQQQPRQQRADVPRQQRVEAPRQQRAETPRQQRAEAPREQRSQARQTHRQQPSNEGSFNRGGGRGESRGHSSNPRAAAFSSRRGGD